MLADIKQWLVSNKLNQILFYGYVVALTVAILMPTSGIEHPDFLDFPYWDKAIHFGLFLILTVLFFFYQIPVKIVGLIIIPLLIGVLLEILQSILPTGRTFDWLDIAANSFGVIFAAIILRNQK